MTGHEPPDPPRVDIVVDDGDAPLCPRCEQPGILSVRVPHNWTNEAGHPVRGTAVVVLCPRCDLDHPEGGALITWFAVHGGVSEENTAEAVQLIEAWARAVEIPKPDVAAIEAEAEAWRRGEL